MKRFSTHIKLVLLLVIIAFLTGFASYRHRLKVNKTPEVDVIFTNGQNLFITNDSVNKLLIQKLKGVEKQPVESLFLNNLEKFVNENDMIKKAEVFQQLNGKIGVLVTQRTPILRVIDKNGSFYLDTEGKQMPLSDNYSARVPVVNAEIIDTAALVKLGNYIRKSDFLQKQVTGIAQKNKEKSQIYLKTRLGEQVVVWGTVSNLRTKELKLKAFYQKALRDNILDRYDTINLKFKNQVVCSKK